MSDQVREYSALHTNTPASRSECLSERRASGFQFLRLTIPSPKVDD